jgi:hypothetical protein
MTTSLGQSQRKWLRICRMTGASRTSSLFNRPRRNFQSTVHGFSDAARSNGTGHVCSLGAHGAYGFSGLVPCRRGWAGQVFLWASWAVRIAGPRPPSTAHPGACNPCLRARARAHSTSGAASRLLPPRVEPWLSNSAKYVSVRPGPLRGTHRSLALVALHIFIDASGPETTPCDFSASEVEARSCCGLERLPRLRSGMLYAALPRRRLRRYFSTSNGWPVRITSKSTGTIFRATADPSGRFVTGFRLSANQLESVLQSGWLW